MNRPPPARPPWWGHLTLVAALPAVLAAAPRALAAQAPNSADEPTLRGELVRFADASVDVSILARDPATIPENLFVRMRAGGSVAFLATGSSEVNETVRRLLEQAVGAAAVRVVQDPSALAPMGIQVDRGDQIRLVWYGRQEAEGVAILADARSSDENFALRILIPDPTVTEEDWWGLQAALSQAGIRRVQILSGRP